MEADLARTQQAVTSLRELLEHRAAPAPIGHRRAGAASAAAISETVDVADVLLWYQGALGELKATLTAQGIRADGVPGGIFASELFTEERGQATIFVPCRVQPRPMGRVTPVVPAAELATIVHPGPHAGIYGEGSAYPGRCAKRGGRR